MLFGVYLFYCLPEILVNYEHFKLYKSGMYIERLVYTKWRLVRSLSRLVECPEVLDRLSEVPTCYLIGVEFWSTTVLRIGTCGGQL